MKDTQNFVTAIALYVLLLLLIYRSKNIQEYRQFVVIKSVENFDNWVGRPRPSHHWERVQGERTPQVHSRGWLGAHTRNPRTGTITIAQGMKWNWFAQNSGGLYQKNWGLIMIIVNFKIIKLLMLLNNDMWCETNLEIRAVLNSPKNKDKQ